MAHSKPLANSRTPATTLTVATITRPCASRGLLCRMLSGRLASRSTRLARSEYEPVGKVGGKTKLSTGYGTAYETGYKKLWGVK